MFMYKIIYYLLFEPINSLWVSGVCIQPSVIEHNDTTVCAAHVHCYAGVPNSSSVGCPPVSELQCLDYNSIHPLMCRRSSLAIVSKVTVNSIQPTLHCFAA